MNNHNKYITVRNERKAFGIVLLIVLVAVVALAVMEFCGVFDKPAEPDVTYPMANANISWDQTFYGWSDAT